MVNTRFKVTYTFASDTTAVARPTARGSYAAVRFLRGRQNRLR